MIDRYSRPILQKLWSDAEKYRFWAKVERAHLEILVENNEAPQNVLEHFDLACQQKTREDFLKREEETGHDVIAFVAELGDGMGTSGAFLHKGLTSSDVVDTALMLRIKESLKIIQESLQSVCAALKERAFEFEHTLCIGRTHGMHAEPMSFGQVLANHYAEFMRAYDELMYVQKQASFGKLSGAVGNYTQHNPEFEMRVLEKLNLQVEPISSQIIPRDRILNVAKALLSCANAVDRFAMNLRHWARTEIAEVSEPFGKKQKGSSAMPHKKNPILSENLCGLARTVRGYFFMIMENATLWHERDISHSSVERVALPDIFAVTDFMLVRLSNLVKNMVVHKENMLSNIEKHNAKWASQNVLTALVEKGMNRTEAYELIQQAALSSPESHFYDALIQNKKICSYLSKEKLQNAFALDKYLKFVSTVFKRVFD